MRRPGWYVGLAWLIGCLAGACLSLNMLLMVTVGSILCFCVTVAVPSLRHRSTVWLSAIGVCGALLVLLITETGRYLPLQQRVDSTVTLTVQVYDTENGVYGRVTEGDLPTGTRLQLWLYGDTLSPAEYEVLSGTFTLRQYDEQGLSLLQRKASGVWFAAVPQQVTVADDPVPWTAVFRDLRRAAVARIHTYLTGDEAALTAGICFGDDSDLSAEAGSNFRVSGVSHLFSVSGFHMVVLAQALQALLAKCRLPRWLRALVAAAAMVFFMLMVGLEPSVVRSGMMCLLVLLGTCFRRQSDTRNSLGLALLLLLVGDPYAAYDVGLLLSFAATFGLVLLFPKLKNGLLSHLPKGWREKGGRVYRLTESGIGAVCITLSASLATLPVMAVYFGETSVVAVLANLLASIPASMLMIVGCVGSLFFLPLLSPVAAFCFLIGGWLARYLLWITEKISNFPLVTVAIGAPYLLLWIIGTAILLYGGWHVAHKRGLRAAAAVSAAALITVIVARTCLMQGVTTIRVFPTQGDTAICFQHGDDTVLLCAPRDVDTVYDIRTQLRLNGIGEIDTLIVPDGSQPALTAVAVLLEEQVAGARLLYGDDAAPLLSYFDETAFLGDTAHILWDGAVLTGHGTALSLTVGETPVLISTDDQSAWSLPAECRQAQAILYSGDLPPDAQLFTAAMGVIQGQRQDPVGAAACGVQRLYVAYRDTVVLMTRGAGDITEAIQ